MSRVDKEENVYQMAFLESTADFDMNDNYVSFEKYVEFISVFLKHLDILSREKVLNNW
jgi:hypothetical protein